MEQIFNYIFAIIFPFGQDGWKVLSLISIIFAIKYFNVWKKDKIILSLLIFLFYGLLLSVFSKDVVSGFEEMQRYFSGWLFPFLLGYAVIDKYHKIKILKVYLIVLSFTILLGFLAYFNVIPDKISYLTFIVDERLGVICGHTIFGGKSSFVVLILSAMFLFWQNNKNKYLILAGIIFYLFALLLSGTRACFISVFCTFVVMLTFYMFKKKEFFKTGLFIFLIFVLSLTVYNFSPFLQQRIKNTSITKEESLIFRIDMYKHGLNLLKEPKLIGYGPSNATKQEGNVHNLPHFHNMYLQIILDFGVIGFILFLTILFFIFKRLIVLYMQTQSVYYLMLIFAWFAILISEMFDCMLRYPFFSAQYFWVTGLILGGIKNEK
ncbi:MAG: O-antigen ligase family protein [Elusimicrobia bacterium]|nr:O-antigen ligase family protein [Elusimicrobiota bacterium]